MIRYLVSALWVLSLASVAGEQAIAEPAAEPLPVKWGSTSSKSFGHSEPLSPQPVGVQAKAVGTTPTTFPYGSPLSYEYRRTCWPHGYCHCRHHTFKARAQCSHWGYPEEFCERPFGVYVRSHFHTQIANGLADQMVLYQYDFYDTAGDQAAMLNPRGLIQVGKVGELASLLYDQFFVVIVEPTGDPELDTARRLHVLEKLTELGAPVTVEQVVTTRPAGLGLDGIEAFDVYRNQLQQTRVLGGSIGSSGSARAAPVPAVSVGIAR
jgi:hypothetical protein